MRDTSIGAGNPLRVAHIDHGTELGGAELALRRLASTALQQNLWNPSIVVPKSVHNPGAFATLAHALVEAGPSQPSGVASSRNPLKLADIMARLAVQALTLRFQDVVAHADIVHTNSTRAGLYTAMGVSKQKPLVLHLRDMITPDALGRPSYEAFRRIALPRASGIIANSEATLASVTPLVSKNTIVDVIPSPSGLVRPGPSREPDQTVKRVGMVARLADWKGQALLLEAFARTFPLGPITLHLYGGTSFGSDDYAHYLKAFAKKLNIYDRTHFHGHVEDVHGAIDSLDICVQASTRPEPLGQNVLQYLALGKPTIAANSGGPAELIDDNINGVLFEMGSVEGLSFALRKLDENYSVRRRIANGAAKTPIRSDTDITVAHSDFFDRVVRLAPRTHG